MSDSTKQHAVNSGDHAQLYLKFILMTQHEVSFINTSREATKRSRDRKKNGKCTNATNRRSRVGLSTPLNDSIAQEASNRTNSFDETEKQRMPNTSGPSLQQIEANSRVPDEIKGQDDKVNDLIVLTIMPSRAPDSNERIASTGARTSLNFSSRLHVNTPAFVP